MSAGLEGSAAGEIAEVGGIHRMEIVGKRPYHVQMMTKDELQTRIGVAKFHQWLGLEVLEASDRHHREAGVARRMDREPGARVHAGGILATLVDVVADYALAAHLGGPAPTVDLRVDTTRPRSRVT
jgi:acyl-coenzyme A thioesterase PaaI-like protein